MTSPLPAGSGSKDAGPSLRLPPDPASVGAARSWVADVCRQWHAGELCDDAALLVSELVSNGIRHAGTELLVELQAAGSAVVVAVSDWSTRPVRARAAAPLDEGGRGLVLVDALSTRWGVTAGPSGKRVWAELQANSSKQRALFKTLL